MPEQKHTNGPWNMIGSTVYVLNSQNPPCNKFYATVQRGVGDDGRYIGDLEVIANANLMAAAPELLEALKDLADDIAERFDLESPSTNPGIKIYVEQARAAIAKATQPLNPA